MITKTNFSKIQYCRILKRLMNQMTTSDGISDNTVGKTISHTKKLTAFFRRYPHMQSIKQFIPAKYLLLKRKTPPDNLYLIDSHIAKDVVQKVLAEITSNKHHLVAETNAGLGFISSELLENGLEKIRLYDSCGEFREGLKDFSKVYPGRVELFSTDLFLLHRYSYSDRQDHGSRVQQLLDGVPIKPWTDVPIMTVFGPLSNMTFIRFLIKSLILQNEVVNRGRIQLYIFMRPKDYIKLTSTPSMNLHVYTSLTILFNLFFDIELIEKYPRHSFLPWESVKIGGGSRLNGIVDADSMYFVRINFKKELPVSMENLLPLYIFVKQFFGRGKVKVIPTLEKWIPGSGLNIIAPKLDHNDYDDLINIFTEFGKLTPNQILYIFTEIRNLPEYELSPFNAMIENQLIKNETIETSLDEHLLEKHIESDIKTKLDL